MSDIESPEPKKRNVGGRPATRVTDETLRQIETLSGYGLTLAQIAAVIGVSEDTMTRMKRDQIQVLRAVERGKARAETFIGKTLFERAKGGDMSAIRWWESTRANRVATVAVENRGTMTHEITVRIAPHED